jgi:hypothetical protein
MRKLKLTNVSKTIRALRLTGLLVVLFSACVEPFQISGTDYVKNLVVDGMITNQSGPYTVRLYYTSGLHDQVGVTNWATHASVSISDDIGNTETLTEVSAGIYQTRKSSELRGHSGRTYVVRIVTSEDEVYESEPEKMIPVGEIKHLNFTFDKKREPGSFDETNNPVNGFNVYVDAEILPEQENRVRWRTTGIFEIRTYPENETKLLGTANGGAAVVPDPPLCSGWIKLTDTTIKQVGECTCCECWVTTYNDQPIFSDSQSDYKGFVSGKKMRFVPADREIFYRKYYLQVEQMSLSKVAYDFWNSIAKQKLQSSDLFQTPPPRAVGNIKSLTPGAPPALGLFSASSVYIKSIFIYRHDIPYPPPPSQRLPMSCLTAYKGSNTIKPSFW